MLLTCSWAAGLGRALRSATLLKRKKRSSTFESFVSSDRDPGLNFFGVCEKTICRLVHRPSWAARLTSPEVPEVMGHRASDARTVFCSLEGSPTAGSGKDPCLASPQLPDPSGCWVLMHILCPSSKLGISSNWSLS